MRIAVGCDHRGLECKERVIKLLGEAGHAYQDFGCLPGEMVDYPDIAGRVARAVVQDGFEFGILICDTGIGMSIAANKVTGVRAALCHNGFMATRAREHNDATILCFSAREAPETVREPVTAFLATPFQGGRHQARLDKIQSLEG
ncbi:MAG: ribose 5-phosphate isomerase B [Chloroflexota bacterium]